MTLDTDITTDPGDAASYSIPMSPYIAPGIEQTISAEEIEREVHYAGGLTCPTCSSST